jgi:hypothetical protein
MKLSWILLFALPLLSACQASILADLVTRPGDRLFWDDFSDPSENWPEGSDEIGTVAFADGAYRMTVDKAEYDLWATSGHSYPAARVEADATRLAGPEANRFGLICGYRDAQNFFFFIISSDGYYALGKIEDDAANLVGQEMMAYSPVISPGTGSNHLQLECTGHTLRGSVNGELLAVADDQALRPGDAGMIAGAFEQGGVDISFDDFVVTKP